MRSSAGILDNDTDIKNSENPESPITCTLKSHLTFYANHSSLPYSVLCASGNDFVHDFSVDVRQAEVTTAVAVSELFVV